MPMRKLNVAVIGTGSWGRNHIRVYDELDSTSLMAIADIDEKAARGYGKKYNVDWYTDPKEVFSRRDIEAVSICTPTITHADLALQAINAGMHVLVEKPMTNTIEEAQNLIKAAESKGVHLSVGFVERFNPAVNKAMEIISEEKIGDVILAHTRRVSRRPLRIGDVGVIKDLAIHDIDIVNQLFKDKAQIVFASAGSIAHSYEDYANILVCYEGNRSGFVETNWLTPRKVRTLTVTGTEGILTVEYITQQVTVENNDQLFQPFLQPGEPLMRELSSFTSSIIEDVPPEVSGEDGLNALKICEAAIESAKKNREIMLDAL